MSSDTVEDFLSKEILIQGNIVTYRSLSRQRSIHVNAAKNALASFYAQTRQDNQSKLAATYLVSGEIEPETKQPDRMDIDEENAEDKDAEYEDDGDEQVETTEVVLVGEQDLERVCKIQISKIFAIHIYSLSPAPIRDMGLICGPTEIVREIDNKKGSEMAVTIGKIVGGDVKVRF
ncbi:hypothetical protein BT96DRAFT_820536 [Gymnopus androsaceus JB14]|uniref:DNA polymerase delta subunit 3 n=1 Tax=Gymnopus androsaceus JB14 TaxID=1447944 RepID=A0A6A4HS66_9AGAR|nr:hypothetical protein BT96DRAFT_820536 [Gymnopus androsaceus JB14]